tara:strand:- start:560 stop:973 length:414 start_codon:yes stop_codon:yes gene_type:complete
MSTKWYYCKETFSTQEDVNQKVLDVKQRLDNNPTDWAIVKQLDGSDESGWVVPRAVLTDAEINNLNANNYYSCSSVVGSDTQIGISSAKTQAKVVEYRKEFCDYYQVNTVAQFTEVDGVITETTEYAPTNADMSGYV